MFGTNSPKTIADKRSWSFLVQSIIKFGGVISAVRKLPFEDYGKEYGWNIFGKYTGLKRIQNGQVPEKGIWFEEIWNKPEVVEQGSRVQTNDEKEIYYINYFRRKGELWSLQLMIFYYVLSYILTNIL